MTRNLSPPNSQNSNQLNKCPTTSSLVILCRHFSENNSDTVFIYKRTQSNSARTRSSFILSQIQWNCIQENQSNCPGSRDLCSWTPPHYAEIYTLDWLLLQCCLQSELSNSTVYVSKLDAILKQTALFKF